MPTSTFFKLPEDKQKNIIEIAFQEFSENVYEKASIRNIIAKADISIGSFYRYFGSKDELYLFLIDYKFGEVNQKSGSFNNDVSNEKFWLNFRESSSEIRKKYYFRVKNNLLYDMRLEKVKSCDSGKSRSEKDLAAIAFLVAVLPYIVQELSDLTKDDYYDNDSSVWVDLMNIIIEGMKAIDKKTEAI